MAGFIFNVGALGLQDGSINWASDTIKIRPVETSDTIDEDDTVMTGLGLTGYDQTLGSKTGPTKDDANNRIVYDAANPTFPSVAAGPQIDRALIFKFVTNDADSIPIALMDIAAITPNGGNIGVLFDAIGAFYTQQ